MKKFLIGAILLVVVIAMAKTVPDKKAHKKAMMEAVKAYVNDEAEEKYGDNILADLGKGIVNKTIEVALNSKLEVNNYLIFNTTSVEVDDETKTLSLGVFGHVFTFDKEMLRDALEASAKEKAEKKSERKAAKEAAKEAKKLEKQKRKEEKKREKEARKEQKRHDKAANKAAKNLIKSVKKTMKESKKKEEEED